MLFNKTIDLITQTKINDDYGQPLPSTTTKNTVFADLKSVGRNEFYQASTAGYTPKMIFCILLSEYNDEVKVEFEGKEYRVIRSYSIDNRITELTCEVWHE